MKKLFYVLALVPLVTGCERETAANEEERNSVNAQQEVFLRNQPTPRFDWSLERSLMIQLYQARNTRTMTYTYVLNSYNGSILMSCPSLGFPIPATTQLTNPQTIAHGYQSITTIDQAEPNGMYAPPSTHGTWVMCLADDGNVEPRYVENDVLTSVRPLRMVDGQLVPVENQTPSLTLRTTR